MSYLERGVYDYIAKILTDGIKVLFSRRFIVFTFLLLMSGFISIYVVLNKGLIDEELIRQFLLLQSAIAISFIVAGLVAKRMISTIRRFLLIIVVISIVMITQFFNIAEINLILLQYFPIFSLFLWTLFMPIAGFGFARGMFYNRITGSLLFLGKPESDKKAIFSVFIIILALIGVVVGISIFSIQADPRIKFVGILASAISILIILVAYGLVTRNDALNSAISVFFIASALPPMVMLLISSGTGVIGTFNYLLLAFSLIFTAQGQAKRAGSFAGKSEEEIRLELAKEKHNNTGTTDSDPFGITKIFNFLGAEGIVLIFLGTFFGYNLLHLEFLHDKSSSTTINPLFGSIFNSMTIGQVYQSAVIVVVSLIVILIIITNYTYFPARKYYKANLIRLSFLPTYDEVKSYITAVQSGEISKKDMTADAVKLLGGQFAKASLSAGKGILDRLGLRKKDRN
jgi:hypothetical protein